MKIRKIMLAVLAVMINLSAFGIETEIDGINYSIIPNGRKAEVIRRDNNKKYSGDIVVPEAITYNGIQCNVTSIGEFAFYQCNNLSSVTIPDGVTNIGANAFYECSNMISVSIPNSVTSIGAGSFYGCHSLSSVTIPSTLTRIDNSTFYACYKLSSITIHDGIQSIGKNAFRDCRSLTIVTIPNFVTAIEDFAFQGCSGLNTVFIGNGLISVGTMVFQGCFGLTSIHISDLTAWCRISFESAESNPLYYAHQLYIDNQLITDLSIPKGVESIGKRDFQNCNTLASITLPSSTMRIEDRAFAKCESLMNVSCYAESVPNTVSNAFADSHPEYITLHVPVTALENYKATEPWSSFGTIVALPYVAYVVDGEVYKQVTIPFGETIIPEEEPTKEGYTFSGWSEIPETMPDHDVVVNGTFTVNSYKLIYIVDGETVSEESIDYGTIITPSEEPTKEGYTFSGWNEIPATMPAHDVTITGSFTINSYKLTYVVDGETIYEEDIDYKSEINPMEEPTKEGFTFSGWSEIPATMPAYDLTVTGTFSVNHYTITYVIDGEVFYSEDVAYGSIISPPDAPEKENNSFVWSDYPETMPAYDLTIEGTYIDGITELPRDSYHTDIYTIDGKKVNNMQRGIYVYKRGSRIVKVKK